MKDPFTTCLAAGSILSLSSCHGFALRPVTKFHWPQETLSLEAARTRREFVAAIATSSWWSIGPSFAVNANDSKSSSKVKSAFRTVELLWYDQPTGGFPIAVDGVSNDRATDSSKSATSVLLTYQLPKTWKTGDADQLYVNQKGQKCCKRITVYQKTGTASVNRLLDAFKNKSGGVARALDIGDRIGSGLKDLRKADLISEPRVTIVRGNQQQQYFEFDMRVPCAVKQGDPAGGCTLDSIFLISATVLNQRLFVCVVECDSEQLAQAGDDLRRVQSSFNVEPA